METMVTLKWANEVARTNFREGKKEGRREVIEWLEKHNNDIRLPLREDEHFHIYIPAEWQAMKKKWRFG